MRKQLLLVASLLLSSALVVVAHPPKETVRPEVKKAIDLAKAELMSFDIHSYAELACADHSTVEIQGGDLYHVASIVSLKEGFEPEVTASIRGPTI